jgi:hypothetical protein
MIFVFITSCNIATRFFVKISLGGNVHYGMDNRRTLSNSQKERNKSLEKINHRLKQVIKGYHYSHFL